MKTMKWNYEINHDNDEMNQMGYQENTGTLNRYDSRVMWQIMTFWSKGEEAILQGVFRRRLFPTLKAGGQCPMKYCVFYPNCPLAEFPFSGTPPSWA